MTEPQQVQIWLVRQMAGVQPPSLGVAIEKSSGNAPKDIHGKPHRPIVREEKVVHRALNLASTQTWMAGYTSCTTKDGTLYRLG